MAGRRRDPKTRVQDAIYRVLTYQSSTRQLRPLGAGIGRPVARRLCHRLPDAGARTGLRRSRTGDAPCARQSAEHARPTMSMSRSSGNADRLCALCAGAQPTWPRSATFATIGDDEARGVRHARWRAPRSRRAFALRRGGALEPHLRSALQLARRRTEHTTTRSDYGSQLRDGAAMLALAAETRARACQSSRK